MEFENEDFSVIVPDYLLNEEQVIDEEQFETADDEETADENEVSSEIDYSSILSEMNSRLENIEANTVDYTEGINGLLANVYFIDFVAFTVFVFLMLGLVIKFFKKFF